MNIVTRDQTRNDFVDVNNIGELVIYCGKSPASWMFIKS